MHRKRTVKRSGVLSSALDVLDDRLALGLGLRLRLRLGLRLRDAGGVILHFLVLTSVWIGLRDS